MVAICKQCGVEIPDGQELCENCMKSQLNTPNTDESYLDNLLQSISLPPENKVVSDNNNLINDDLLEDINLEELENDFLDDIDIDKLENDVIKDINLEELKNETLEDIDLDALQDNSLGDINLEESKSLEETNEETNLKGLQRESDENINFDELEDVPIAEAKNIEISQNDRSEETILDDNISNFVLEDMHLEDVVNDTLVDTNDDTTLEELDDTSETSIEISEEDNKNSNDMEPTVGTENIMLEEDVKEELDDVVGSLLNDLDSSGGASLSEDEIENMSEEITSEAEDQNGNETDPMGDVEDLLGILASEAMEEGETLNSGIDEVKKEDTAEDIFSLDNIGDIENLLEDVPEDTAEENEEEKRKIFSELEQTGDSLETNILEDLPSEKELEKKKGIIHRLFGNIFDDKSKKTHKKLEEDEEKSLQKKQTKKEKKEAKKAAKNDPAVKAEQEAKKKEKEAKKAEAKAIKAEKKKEKEEKKKQRLAQEEEEAKKDQGRINPIGAAIVFILAGAATVFVVFGSKSFSYSKSLNEAEKYFAGRDYALAYEEVRGIDIKDKDLETYDKIVTVMYVNKQLNSYNNYYNMKMYPQALDSLLKGLKKYDEYIVTAKKLGVQSDFEYLKKQIVKEMKRVFKLNESQAYKIIDNVDQEIYSQKVVEVADKNIKN